MSAIKYLFFIPLAFFFLPSQADAAVFYADLSAACGGNGSATTTPFCSLDEFAEVSRSPGDILHVRRGSATTTGITDILPTSDGTLNNPITITADYDNLWGDFSTSSITVTATQGSTTINTSASTTDITVGDWIYLAGDCYERTSTMATNINSCEYAYEVATATPTYLEFYLPYKGFQTSAGTAVRRMPPNPIWNTSTGDFQFYLFNDNYWKLKGLTLRATDISGTIALTNSCGFLGYDLIFITDSADPPMISTLKENTLKKTRVVSSRLFDQNSGGASIAATYVDIRLICNSSSAFFSTQVGYDVLINNIKIDGCSSGSAVTLGGKLVIQNYQASFSNSGLSGDAPGSITYYMDMFGQVGLNSQSTYHISNNALATTTQSVTTNLRTGGALKNLYIIPQSGTGDTGQSVTSFPHSYIELFEYPIYSDGTSKTYTMYFDTASSGAFTVNPLTQTASGSSTPELFIECEYYADPIDADRVTKRSNTASDVDFVGSTDWQDISVTCDPSQAGILYLRGYYGKPKESTATNEFYMDIQPIIQ